MSKRVRVILATTTVWHLVCLVMLYVYQYCIGPIVVALYTAAFGDIQSSIGIFTRLTIFLGYVVTTSPASLMSLYLFDRLSQRSMNWSQVAFAVCVWQLVVVTVLVGSYEMGFEYWLHQLGWSVFGAPEDLYSFRNLFLHRIVAWFICTTPLACAVLWVYSKLTATSSVSKLPKNPPEATAMHAPRTA